MIMAPAGVSGMPESCAAYDQEPARKIGGESILFGGGARGQNRPVASGGAGYGWALRERGGIGQHRPSRPNPRLPSFLSPVD